MVRSRPKFSSVEPRTGDRAEQLTLALRSPMALAPLGVCAADESFVAFKADEEFVYEAAARVLHRKQTPPAT
jgi:hypothetical protein